MSVRPAFLPGVAALLTSAGCAVHNPTAYITPPSPVSIPDTFYPAEVDYELLGLVTGSACADMAQLEREGAKETRAIVPGTGHPAVYQAARYDALEKAGDADNLASVRAKVTWENGKECVEVTGRAYRVTGMRSVAGAEGGPGTALLIAPGPTKAAAAATKMRTSSGPLPSRGVVTIGLPSAYGGIPITLAWVKQMGAVALDFGALVNTEGAMASPTAGVLGGYTVGKTYVYGGARFGYSILELEGPFVEVAAGADMHWQRAGLRIETAALLPFEDDGVMLRLSAGPSFSF